MPGQVNMQATQIKQGRRKILLHFVLLFSILLYGRDKRAAIDDGDIELFHRAKLIISQQSTVYSRQFAVESSKVGHCTSGFSDMFSLSSQINNGDKSFYPGNLGTSYQYL